MDVSVALRSWHLEEAYQQATGAENSPGKGNALRGIVNVFATDDFVRGFEVAEAAVKAANQLPCDKTGLAPDDTQSVGVSYRQVQA